MPFSDLPRRIISIHSPLAGRDSGRSRQSGGLDNFNPLAPRGARRFLVFPIPLRQVYFNPLAPRGARHPADERHQRCDHISIHSPLAGRDGSDRKYRLPLKDFNPLAPRGARQKVLKKAGGLCEISIHSPLAGRDGAHEHEIDMIMRFQSTRPSRGETHAGGTGGRGKSHFNPLAPRGARPRRSPSRLTSATFQSTRPSRGETALAGISSPPMTDFNPLAPRGARRAMACVA